MKAAIFREPGAPLTVEEIPTPTPRTGEVLVRVAACGVCHTDLHVLKGEVKFPAPGVLGHEISGTVEVVGPGVPRSRQGDRVVASFIMPCGSCEACARGRDDLCKTFFALNRLRGVLYDGESRLRRPDGSPLTMYSMGGLAEYAVVPAADVFPLPPELPLEESAILGCAVMTAYGALRHAGQLRAAESLAVIGVGGVGSSAIQLGRALGAFPMIAVDVREEKLAAARALGATHTVDASRADPVAAVLDIAPGGVHLALEALGRPDTVAQAVAMARDGGRAVLVGIAAGQATAPIEITRLVRRGLQLLGSYGCRVRADMPDVIALAQAGRVSVTQPITRRYRLEQAAEAYQALDRGEIVGRALVTMSG
jgi:S-(hydroxymethyl)glutathione dehydrogenase/alcohol dehydrogenase